MILTTTAAGASSNGALYFIFINQTNHNLTQVCKRRLLGVQKKIWDFSGILPTDTSATGFQSCNNFIFLIEK